MTNAAEATPTTWTSSDTLWLMTMRSFSERERATPISPIPAVSEMAIEKAANALFAALEVRS